MCTGVAMFTYSCTVCLQVCACTRTSTTERSRCGTTDVTLYVPVKMETLDSTDAKRGKLDNFYILRLFGKKNTKKTEYFLSLHELVKKYRNVVAPTSLAWLELVLNKICLISLIL